MKVIVGWLAQSFKTSETKVLVIAVLWALAVRFIPGVPLDIPVDLTAAGLGNISASPGTLLVYVLGRALVKGFTDGSFPFMPATPPAKEAE